MTMAFKTELPRVKSRGLFWVCMLLACAMAITACQAQDLVSKPPRSGQEVMLTMLAYNYTDNYIDSYEVDGASGGNVFVSGPTSGGGGGTCCVRWLVGRPLPVKVHIRWESGACVYTKRVDGEDFERAKQFFSERDVWLTTPPSENPQFFETHFYPDGHIEVAVTDDYTPPRLKLPRTKHMVRPGSKDQPRCTSEQLHQGES